LFYFNERLSKLHGAAEKRAIIKPTVMRISVGFIIASFSAAPSIISTR
jgi:limonene-1,2-epoxide hydrolase